MNPYQTLPPHNFWKTGVEKQHPLTMKNMYKKKFNIEYKDKIATAGSCFAQHIATHLKSSGYIILDKEPPAYYGKSPENFGQNFGYNLYSARYGNIYHVRQLLQLAKESILGVVNKDDLCWIGKNGKFHDSMRPTVEPEGLNSEEEVVLHRQKHIQSVKELLEEANIFIFTLGLTEAWVNKQTGRVYPMCPGTFAGTFDEEKYEFINFNYNEIYNDLIEFIELVKSINPTIKFILTVSPVPLTATASNNHVIVATTYSKSILRAVAGEVSIREDVDYFPSYEIIASHWSKGFFYESNMRSVNKGGVDVVMKVFSQEHLPKKDLKINSEKLSSKDDLVCDEILLEAFSK